MDVYESLLITVVDKGVLAGLIVALGYKVKLWLQEDQARRDLVREVSSQRADAYAKIWKATEDFRSTNPPELHDDRLRTARETLHKAYFDEGGAMYLSFEAARLLVKAKSALAARLDAGGTDGTVTDDDLRKAFSDFRTQLKTDLLIYTEAEKNTHLRAKKSAEPLAL